MSKLRGVRQVKRARRNIKIKDLQEKKELETKKKT